MEEAEKTKDSRLAKEFVVALTVELDWEQWQALLTEFIQNQFVVDGMCADVSIHDTDGHNPYAHTMLTVCPLNRDSTQRHKTEKESLCVKGGDDKGISAVTRDVSAQEDSLQKILKLEEKYAVEQDLEFKEYAELQVQAADINSA